MENKIKTKKRKVEKEEVVGHCPHCNQEVIGSTEEQVRYNIETHIRAKHKESK